MNQLWLDSGTIQSTTMWVLSLVLITDSVNLSDIQKVSRPFQVTARCWTAGSVTPSSYRPQTWPTTRYSWTSSATANRSTSLSRSPCAPLCRTARRSVSTVLWPIGNVIFGHELLASAFYSVYFLDITSLLSTCSIVSTFHPSWETTKRLRCNSGVWFYPTKKGNPYHCSNLGTWDSCF